MRNPKSEILNSKQIQMTKIQNSKQLKLTEPLKEKIGEQEDLIKEATELMKIFGSIVENTK